MKEIKCPNCGSKAIDTTGAGTPLILLGLMMSIFLVTIIIGVPIMLMGFYVNHDNKKKGQLNCRCESCNYKFKTLK